MSKILRSRVSDDLFDSLQRIARSQNKSLSRFAAELLQSAVKQEMKDVALLNRLVQRIESLSVNQNQIHQQQLQSEIDFEKFKQLFLLLFSLIREHGRLVFVLPEKAQKFSQIADEIEKKISEF